MNKFYLTILSTLIAFSASSAEVTSSFYTRKSVLSEGKWVKIGVEQTGVYEISYETLRRMGFEPEKVVVYGRGGNEMTPNFTNANGNLQLNDDLSKVKIFRSNGKLIFYAQGVGKVSFSPESKIPLKGSYSRRSHNIYSKRGYYFLTDQGSPDLMTATTSANVDNLELREECVAFIHHEEDLYQNNSRSGQLYWGEKVNDGTKSYYEWDVNIPDAIEGNNGWMYCQFYAEEDNEATLSYGMRGTDKFVSHPVMDDLESTFKPQKLPSGTNNLVAVTSGKGKVFVDHSTAFTPEISNVDWWTLNYLSRIPTLRYPEGEAPSQQRFALTGLSSSKSVMVKIPDAANYYILNVSTPTSPTLILSDRKEGVSTFKITSNTSYADLVVIDPSRPLLQISGYSSVYSPVANQNLHQYADEGADYLIITTPRFREYAEQIADIHREQERMKVVVATTEECYNEFSGGVPDPMAYRSLAKMLYLGKNRLSNILLLGPLYAENRGLEVERDPMDAIIAFQSTICSENKGSQNVNDFYGMMSDKVNLDNLQDEVIHIGVGTLPVKFEREAEMAVKKIRDFYNDKTWAYRLNKLVSVGGIYDKHTHSKQARDFSDTIGTFEGRSSIATPLIIDAYGNSGARRKLLEEINGGTTFMVYFGHGAETMLGKDHLFFNANDVMRMKNQYLPLTCYAGCTLSNSDRGRRGIGESIVTSTPYGAIGSILATRETWSGQNYDFFVTLFRLMYQEENLVGANRLTDPRTIGEVYALAKTASRYTNEMAYQLMCDPAIKFPVATRKIRIDENVKEAECGNDLIFQGFIDNTEGEPDTSFNGEIVVRLMEPLVTLPCQNLVTAGTEDAVEGLNIDYAQTQTTMAVAKVEEGLFTLRLHIPESTNCFDNQIGRLHLSAFDSEQWLGAGSMYPLTYKKLDALSSSAESSDYTAPIVNILAYEPKDSSLYVIVSDDYCLNLSQAPLNKGFTIWLDGKELADAPNHMPILSDNNLRAERIIPLGDLSYGTHCAKVRVKDAAGNSTESEIVFDHTPGKSHFVLTVDSYAPDEDICFSFDGAAPSEGILYIIDADGNEVYSTAFEGDYIEWDRTDFRGNRVGAGHYKAYVIESGKSSRRGHSNTISLPLI